MRAALLVLISLAAACGREQVSESKSANPASSEVAVVTKIEAANSSPSLAQLWSAPGFFAPEGVALAPDGAYFISNVGGEETDGDGYISKIAPNGAFIAERFIDGLDGPKGMAVHDGFLYVADNVVVRIFDAQTGAPGAVIKIPGGEYLNDTTVWGDEIYVSDSGASKIWRLSADGPVVWREGEELRGVNGLLGDGDRMFVSTMTTGSLFEATADGGWHTIASGMIDADGIGIVPDALGGGFLVSSWPGDIHYVSSAGEASKILDTRDEGILQNDLTMFGDLVIVPNWEPGTVTAWRLGAAN